MTFRGPLILSLLLPVGLTADGAAAPLRPNVVLIYADDLGYGDIAAQGASGFSTPNIDQLGKDGTRFTHFYVAQPVCTASRAALMTGCYSNRVGLSGALNHTSKVGINPDDSCSASCSTRMATRRRSSASGTLVISSRFCRLATGSTSLPGCRTRTTTARCIRSSGTSPHCRGMRGSRSPSSIPISRSSRSG
jgi:hypothetical protein